MLPLSWKFGESKWNPDYRINMHEYFDQYGSFTIPSKMMLLNHPASLVDQLDKLMELKKF